MCWNKDVSLNTFLFSSLILILIIYNNKFTKYKIHELNNNFIYFFLFSFILIQLIEYFIWKNLNNSFYNRFFSIIASFILFLQPIASIFIIKNIQIRNLLLSIYLLFSIPFSLFTFSNTKFSASVAPNGHLKWNWISNSNLKYLTYTFYLLFLFYPIIREKLYFISSFAFILFLISFYSYFKSGTFESMWCWISNLIMLFYAFKLLIYLPFFKN